MRRPPRAPLEFHEIHRVGQPIPHHGGPRLRSVHHKTVITSAPATATYGTSISVQTPDAASIGSVSLMRIGSVTHSFNTSQNIVQAAFTAGAGALSVQTPANANLAPPGYYMLFILNTNGVPSVASIMQLQ